METIFLGVERESREDAIRRCGKVLVDAGCVQPRYIEGMLARDRSFSTAIGNCIAIPHGEKAYKADIVKTGMAVLTYPQGIDWGGQTVHLVIGIAANGDEHLEILENIVEVFEEEADVLELVRRGDKEAVYSALTGGAV